MEVNGQENGAFLSTLSDNCPNKDDENLLTAEFIEEAKKAIAFFEQIKPKNSSFEEKNTQVPDKKDCDVNSNCSKGDALKFSGISDNPSSLLDMCDIKTELLDDVKPPDSVFHSEYIIKDEEFSYDDMVDDYNFYNAGKYGVETNWEESAVFPNHLENSNSINSSKFFNPIVKLEKFPEPIVNTRLRFKNLNGSGSQRNMNYIQRYCYKCKKMEREYVRVSKSKNCRICLNPLIYVCTKCNERCYLNYTPMLVHWKSCKSIQTANNILNAIVMYHCSDCNFKTLRELSMALHMTRTGHYSKDADEMMHGVNVFDKASCTLSETKIDFSKLVKRYCSKCSSTIAEASSTVINEDCPDCEKRLIYICTSCSTLCNSNISMRYHLRTKCKFPNLYKCNKCSYVATYWQLMVLHLKSRHTERPDFLCAHCTFKSKYKYYLTKHLRKRHGELLKNYRCEICYEYRTGDKKQLKEHVFRVHFG